MHTVNNPSTDIHQTYILPCYCSVILNLKVSSRGIDVYQVSQSLSKHQHQFSVQDHIHDVFFASFTNHSCYKQNISFLFWQLPVSRDVPLSAMYSSSSSLWWFDSCSPSI